MVSIWPTSNTLYYSDVCSDKQSVLVSLDPQTRPQTYVTTPRHLGSDTYLLTHQHFTLDFLIEPKSEFLFLTETWRHAKDFPYSMNCFPTSSQEGGPTIINWKPGYSARQLHSVPTVLLPPNQMAIF